MGVKMSNKVTITNRDLYEEIQEVSKKSEKLRAQVKSRWYYIFWGTATVSVVLGQIYVGSGYRVMSGAFFQLLESVEIDLQEDLWRHEHSLEGHPMIIK